MCQGSFGGWAGIGDLQVGGEAHLQRHAVGAEHFLPGNRDESRPDVRLADREKPGPVPVLAGRHYGLEPATCVVQAPLELVHGHSPQSVLHDDHGGDHDNDYCNRVLHKDLQKCPVSKDPGPAAEV